MYITIVVLVAGALVTTFITLNTTLARNKLERDVAHTGEVALERISRAIREGTAIDTAASTFGTSVGSLEVEHGSDTTRFFIQSGDLMVSVNGTTVGPLTSDAVTVHSLVFRHYVGSTSEMVRAELVLSAQNKAASTTRTYYSSAVLRGTYD